MAAIHGIFTFKDTITRRKGLLAPSAEEWMTNLKDLWQFDVCLSVAWQLPDDCLTTVLQFSDNCLMTTWQLLDNFITLTWPLNDSKLHNDYIKTGQQKVMSLWGCPCGA